MKKWLRERYYQHILRRFSYFSSLVATADAWDVNPQTVRHWIRRGWVRAYRANGIWYVNYDDANRQYRRTGRISQAQRLRYERERADKADNRPLLQKLGDAQNMHNTLLGMAMKTGMSVEEPEPEGDTDDDGRSAEDHQP